MKPKKSILEKFAEAKANLRRLEYELQAEINDDIYAIVLRKGNIGDIPVGALVKITEFDGDETHYLRVETVDGSRRDYFSAEDLEIVTSREQARAALLTGIERQIDAIFGDSSEASDE